MYIYHISYIIYHISYIIYIYTIVTIRGFPICIREICIFIHCICMSTEHKWWRLPLGPQRRSSTSLRGLNHGDSWTEKRGRGIFKWDRKYDIDIDSYPQKKWKRWNWPLFKSDFMRFDFIGRCYLCPYHMYIVLFHYFLTILHYTFFGTRYYILIWAHIWPPYMAALVICAKKNWL